MNWNRWTIGKRIAAGLGVVLVLLFAVGLISFVGIGDIVENAKRVIRGNQLDGTLAQKEVDHLNWANKINALLTDENVREMQVETDDHKCEFGKWLYGEDRKQAEAMVPSLVPLLKEIEVPHHKLHQSALEIQKQFHQADEKLPGFLAAKEVDHLKWVAKIKDLFLLNPAELKIETDCQKCSFGQWLHGDGARDVLSKTPELTDSFEVLIGSHRELHQSAIEIQQVYKKIHPGLRNTLKDRLDDHRRWAAQVSQSIIENRKNLEVVTDPAGCGFGRFLVSEEAAAWMIDFPEMKATIEAIKEPHDKLHASAIEIDKALGSGNRVQAEHIYIDETLPILDKIGMHFKSLILAEDQLRDAQTRAKSVFEAGTIPAFNKTAEMLNKIKEEAEKMLEGTREANRIYAQISLPALKQTQGLLNDIRAEAKKNIMTDQAMLSAALATKRNISVVGIISIISGVLFGFLITRGIITVLRRVSLEMDAAAEQVAAASVQASSASQSMAEGASEQAASVEETSSSMEEMASMTRQNAANATEANNLMKEAGDIIDEANTAMLTLNKSMDEISQASSETQKIIKTIDEIAFQTNLLALNAAVEAARAGEAGAGFAVVAEEVRNLAMRAAEAAKNTAGMIEGSIKKIDDGSALARKTNESFSKVSEVTKKIGDLVGEISGGSNEQAQGIEQVNRAISEMDRVIQLNASNAEESATVAEEMSSQAFQMKDNVKDLLALVGSNNGKQNETRDRKLSPGEKRNSLKAERALVHSEKKKGHSVPALSFDAEDVTEF